ncbi:MAG TPA: hypothetical protein VJB94_00425 [Candidatus Nanoarchaeia archaeon]|nr:hypothetical protein [Candidatus Nanoarchaeia archaeon]
MAKKNNFAIGFNIGDKTQTILDILPKDNKLEKEKRLEIGKKVLILGGLSRLFSEKKEDKELGEKAMGFGASFILGCILR